MLAMTFYPEHVDTIEGHAREVAASAMSPERNLLASGSRDGSVRVWNLREKKELWNRKIGKEVYSVKWSPNGKLIASASWPMCHMLAREGEGLDLQGIRAAE